ncbi:MAG: hypothetical protein VW835_15085 [Rickettsiales bacterium]
MTLYKGSCHCGAVAVELETETDPADIEVRECQCSFCRAHGAVSASDPNGRIRYIEQEPGAIHRYRFGTKSCDFLICRNCGVYLGATMEGDGTPGYSTTQIKHFEDRALFTKTAKHPDYDGEPLDSRLARQRRNWTPIAG